MNTPDVVPPDFDPDTWQNKKWPIVDRLWNHHYTYIGFALGVALGGGGVMTFTTWWLQR